MNGNYCTTYFSFFIFCMILNVYCYKSLKDPERTETASPKTKAGGKKDRKKNQQGKDKRVTVSLKDFQQEGGVGEKCCILIERERERDGGQISVTILLCERDRGRSN